MTSAPPVLPATRRVDAGFTLVELLIALVLSTIIGGVIVAAMITSLNASSSTTAQVNDSTDAGLVSAFLFRDAQAAGATNAATGLLDTTVGVSTVADTAGWAGCTQPGTLVVRFSWLDRTDIANVHTVVASYALDSTGQLTRRLCQNGTSTDVVLGHTVTAASASCEPDPTCSGLAGTVAVTLTGSGQRVPLTYTLRASVRPDHQTLPVAANSSPVPFLALADPASKSACPTVSLGGTGAITVMGDALVSAQCGTNAITGNTKMLQPSGTTAVISGLTDPFAAVTPPKASCGAGTNPTPLGASPAADAVVVYPSPVVISVTQNFKPGRYVFCKGLVIDKGANVSGTGVLLYVAGGTMTVDPNAIVDLSPTVTGDYANLLVWVATPQTVTLSEGQDVDSYRGFVYAPSSEVDLIGTSATNVGGIITKSLLFSGPGSTRIGLPLPTVTVMPSLLPRGQVGMPYTPTPMLAAGGVATYRWWSSGLPSGLSLDPATGLLSGSPTASGSFAVVVTTWDTTDVAGSTRYALTVNPKVAISGPATIPTGQVGVTYTTAIVGAGGTTPYLWSATGLPAGLVINPATGAISGSPKVSGTFNVAVTITDAIGATASTSYPLAVNAQLAVSGPATMPAGVVGVPYSSTVTATGGTTPYAWSATGLPPGLTINPTSGAITGTPKAPGASAVVVTATDGISATATKSYTVTVTSSLVVTGPATLPGGVVGVVYAPTTMTGSGGTAPYVWSATGLPTGMSIAGPTGIISGTPTVAGNFSVAVTVTDASLSTATSTLALSVTKTPIPPGCPANPTGWRGEYYSNKNLTGNPTVCRDDASIAFDWAYGSPDPAVPSDQFSARWTQTQTFAAGDYTFTMGSDDGGRLYIDGTLILDRWVDQGYPSPPPSVVATLTAGPHTIVMEYYENGGYAKATLTSKLHVPAVCPTSPAGWVGQYYSNVSLTGLPDVCRDDASINFNWGSGSPDPVIPSDYFSARWTRTQKFNAGTYTFALGTDDGGRLYIDGTLVIDRWVDQGYPSPQPSAAVKLTAGNHTLVVEYYERGGLAQATLTQSP